MKYTIIIIGLFLVACNDWEERNIGDAINYSGTSYFLNEPDVYEDTIPAQINLVRDGGVFRGSFISGSLRDSLVLTVFERDDKFHFSGKAFTEFDSVDIEFSEVLLGPAGAIRRALQDQYKISGKWRIFTLYEN